MKNIINFLEKYGNSTFQEKKFTEADLIIFTQLSYTNLNKIVPESFFKGIFLSDAIKKSKIYNSCDICENKFKLLSLVVNCKRYKNVKVCGYWYANCVAGEPIQFAAMTFKIFDNLNIVSYRGTDSTLHGWKEDFLFGYRKKTQAQKSARIYLEKAFERLRGRFIISGHSKGGNLAVYSSAFINDSNIDRVVKIYNYDGPGFNESQDIFKSKPYKKLCSRIVCLRPQHSIIGQLLIDAPYCKNYVIHSNSTGIIQHDLFSWEINDNGNLNLHHPNRIDIKYKFLMDIINNKIFSLSFNKRKEFIEYIFAIFEIGDLGTEIMKKIEKYI